MSLSSEKLRGQERTGQSPGDSMLEMESWGGSSLTAIAAVSEGHGLLLRDIKSQSIFKSPAQVGG